jgi:hypothetical protein
VAHQPSEVVPFPATASARGWHGMTARNQKRYRPDDWQIWGKLGDDARLVDSVRDSPAWRSDIRTGVWVISVDGIGFDAFERSPGAVGDIVEVRAFCTGLGSFSRKLVLVEQPAKTASSPRQRSRVPPAWKRERPVLPGKQVFKDTRARYLEFAAQHPYVRRHTWLLARLLKMQWHRGIIPRHKTIAAAARVGISAVKLSQACCQHFGFVRVISGKQSHKNNVYEICWPAGSEPR